MQDRSARIRYQDIATNSSPLQCGLPQGSPVSPILFLLYTESIYRLGSSKGRFGYADDTAILCVGDSLDETSAEASHHVRELVSWGAANRISFDPEKTEVMHFSRTTPKTAPPVLHGEFEKRPGRAMRWLGVWLDSTLSFKTHVEKWTAKAQAVAFHLRRLTNTRHGPLPSAVRRAVCACVIPVLLYAAEVWYPGSTRPRWTKPGKEGPSRIGHLRGFVEEQTAPLQSASKNETAKKFRDWLQALSPRTLVVYSDGSRSAEGHAGYGYVVHRDGSTVLRDKGRLGPAEVFDAEAKAHLRKIARQQPEEAFKAWWEASAPERYRDLRLKATTSCLVTTMRD
ncbi:reverse transcriptase (RNA-dependent DNA polymerase) [Hirsutella rhossiliensis]